MRPRALGRRVASPATATTIFTHRYPQEGAVARSPQELTLSEGPGRTMRREHPRRSAPRHHERTGGAVSNPLTDWVDHRSRPSGHVCCAKKEPSPYLNSGDGFLLSGHGMGSTAGSTGSGAQRHPHHRHDAHHVSHHGAHRRPIAGGIMSSLQRLSLRTDLELVRDAAVGRGGAPPLRTGGGLAGFLSYRPLPALRRRTRARCSGPQELGRMPAFPSPIAAAFRVQTKPGLGYPDLRT